MTEMSSTNTKVLLARLIDYRKSLENHLNQLGSEYIQIEANSGDLRNNMGKVTDNKIPHTNQYYPEGKYQAHHVIPGESANNSPLVRAAIDLGFDLDSAINGIYLPATDEQQQVLKMMTDVELPKHSGYHSTYSRMIDDILEIHWQDLGDGDRLSAYFLSKNDTELEPKIINTLYNAIDIIKHLIVDGTLEREDMYKKKSKKNLRM